MEGCGDDDVSLRQELLKLAVWAILVSCRGTDQLVRVDADCLLRFMRTTPPVKEPAKVHHSVYVTARQDVRDSKLKAQLVPGHPRTGLLVGKATVNQRHCARLQVFCC